MARQYQATILLLPIERIELRIDVEHCKALAGLARLNAGGGTGDGHRGDGRCGSGIASACPTTATTGQQQNAGEMKNKRGFAAHTHAHLRITVGAHLVLPCLGARSPTSPNLECLLAYQTPGGYDFQYAGIGMN